MAIAKTNADVTVNPASLTFTANSRNVPQTVTVKAADDTILVDGSDTLTHTAAGAGSGFESVSASLTVTIEDTSTPGIALTQNSVAVTALTVDEEGSNVAYRYPQRVLVLD